MGWRTSVAILAVVVFVGSCAGGSDSTANPVTPTPEPTAAAGADEDTADLAEYMADYAELSFGLAAALPDPAVADAFASYVAAIDDFNASLGELDPPETAEGVHNQFRAIYRRLSDAMHTVLDAEDPAVRQQAQSEVRQAIEASAEGLHGTTAEWTRLLMSVFATRPDLPEAVYFRETQAGGLASTSAAVQEMVSGLDLLVLESDPAGALDRFAAASIGMKALVDQSRAVDPPPSLEDLHRRYLKNLEETDAAFQALRDALRDGEPTLSVMEQLEDLPSFEQTEAIRTEMDKAMIRVLRDIAAS